MQVICLIVVLALVYWLSIKKLGFVFFRKRISFNNQKTRMHNILLLFILMMGIGVIQLAIISFTENLSLIYVLTGLIVIAAVGLMITYIKNKKEIDEKIDRTKKLEK
jgi:protein-S-isoprenylcysteine O-methyltransferase Ste14